MSLQQMYPAKSNSPRSFLAAAVETDSTSMTLDDASVLPPITEQNPVNLFVLGTGDDAEIVSYSAINGNVVSGIVRGINGTIAAAWPVNTIVARNFTAQDAEAFRQNILDLDERKTDKSYVDTGLNGKQDTLQWDTTPTAGSTNPVTSGGIKTALDGKVDVDAVVTPISTGSIDDITTTGFYVLNSGVTDLPEGSNGCLYSISGTNGWRKQIFIRHGTIGSNDNNIFWRGGNSSGWGSWWKVNDSNQYYTKTEVDTALAVKANSANPSFTGTPTAPTAAKGTNTMQIATTAFVKTGLDDKVNKSGDTMTGVLNTRTSYNIDAENPTAQNKDFIFFYDTNEHRIGMIRGSITANGTSGIEFDNSRTIGTSNVFHGLRLLIDKNGTRSVFVHDPAAWRNALELSDSGWQELTNSTVFKGTIYYRKIGSLVQIYSNDTKLENELTLNSIALTSGIPNGYRPENTLTFSTCSVGAGGVASPAVMRITSNGTLTLYKPMNLETIKTSYSITFSMMYFVG